MQKSERNKNMIKDPNGLKIMNDCAGVSQQRPTGLGWKILPAVPSLNKGLA
jgi:hypothetical protein